jgi:DNA-binding transcriptional MerR regulator
MRKTVKQVAKAANISIRALHHYDHIGLLKPESGSNGYRYYGEPEMLRLQRILFYREIGLSLGEIRKLLDDPGFDARSALIDLRQRLLGEIDRFGELARTVERTIASLDMGSALKDRTLFAGISAEKQAEWEAELTFLYGDAARTAIATSHAALSALSVTALVDFKAEIDAIHTAYVGLIQADVAPESASAQTLTARHYAWVCRSWTPDASAYAGLGALYLDHDEFRSMYDAIHPELARYLAAAISIFAERSLDRSAS